MRVDKYIAVKDPTLSRAQVQKLIKDKKVLINGKPVKASHKVDEGDKIEWPNETVSFELKPEDNILDILFENEDLIVVNKPSGVVVHPGEGDSHVSGTVVNYMLEKLDSELIEEDALRPGIVHRIDKETSGCLVVAKNKKSYLHLVEQFKKRTVYKKYLCLVNGNLEHKKGKINSPISRSIFNRKQMSISNSASAKNAVSLYQVEEEFKFDDKEFSYLSVEILTGRTHQIRVHMKAIGHSVVGDSVYGKKAINDLFKDKLNLNRQFLHAYILEFEDLNGNLIKVEAPLANDLENVLKAIR